MNNWETTVSHPNGPMVYISPVAMKSGDEITFHGPHFDNPKDKQRLKELEQTLAKLQTEHTALKESYRRLEHIYNTRNEKWENVR